MGNAKKKKTIKKPIEERYTLKNAVANWFLVAAFTVFPLWVNLTLNGSFPFLHFDDGFVGIRHQKYYFFLAIAALAVIAEIMLLVTKASSEKSEPNPKKQTLLQTISFTDWAAIALVLSCAISTLFSEHLEMALFGETTVGSYTHGRNNGLLLILFYVAVYFMLTRCFRFKEYVFTAMAITSCAVYMLAILNGFFIDPLNMFGEFVNDETVFNNFMTTIGNKNMFASFICVTLPVIVTLFVHAKELWRRAVYLTAAAVGAMAAVVCDSDSVVLGIGVFAAVFLVVYARRPASLKRYLLTLTVMLCSVKLLGLIAVWSGGNYKELGAIPSKIMLSPLSFAALGVLAVITAALYFFDSKRPETIFPKAVPIIIGCVFGLAALGMLGTFIYFSTVDVSSDLGDAERLLRFSDSWGTHRGFMWNKAFEAFGGYNFFQKLFGTGPETFYFSFSPYFGELWDRFGDTSTDAAHNEYINYLLNIGIVGLASYLTFTGSALVRAFKSAKKKPMALVFASAVVAYMAQAIVNIAVPIATPLFIIFVSLCEAVARQEKERESQCA